MNRKIEDFSKYIKGKKVSLIGAGISNMAAVDFLLSMGALLSARDKQHDENKEIFLRNKGVKTVFGEGYLDDIDEDVLLKSPGIRTDVPQIKAARERGALVTSEMEVFLALCPSKIYAVTGSDGKTTTTTLIYEMLREEYARQGRGKVYLGGNIGTPLLPFVCDMTESDAAVAELSSFQLFAMKAHIDVAVVTNVTPNHLNWHIDMDEYIAAKAKIFESHTENDRLVLNAENDVTLSFADRTKADVVLFSSVNPIEKGKGVYLDGGHIVYTDGENRFTMMERSDIKIPEKFYNL